MAMKIFTLSRSEIEELAAMTESADADQRTFRLAIDCGTVKAKVGEGMWTIGLGTAEDV